MRPSLRLQSLNSFLALSFAVWLAVALRWILEFFEEAHPYIWLLSLLLLAYGILLGLSRAIIQRAQKWAHLLLAIQSTLILSAMLLYFELDFFALLFIPLAGLAAINFQGWRRLTWLIGFGIAIVAGQAIQFGWPEGLSFSLLYLAALAFTAGYTSLLKRANQARRESDRLLGELQETHAQLQQYTHSAEEPAIANERNRMARELHDSVAQTLYGLNLQSAAAARHLAEGRVDQVHQTLIEIQERTLQSLRDTRLLIFELRPPILVEAGLSAALQARLEAVERRSGVRAHPKITSMARLPAAVENGLYRIAQEGLNNVLKHAQAGQIWVTLEGKDGKLRLEIRDDGCGFDPDQSGHGIGLAGMRERVNELGGTIHIISEPGTGTTLQVEVPVE